MKTFIAAAITSALLSTSAFATSGSWVIADQANGSANPNCITFVMHDDGHATYPLSGVVYGFSVNDPGAFAAFTNMKNSEPSVINPTGSPFYFTIGGGPHPGDCSVGVIYTSKQAN